MTPTSRTGSFARFAAALAMVIFGGCSSNDGRGVSSDSSAPIIRVSAQPATIDLPIPDFTLTDQKGRTVRRADLMGRVWVADFIFTTCPTICPRLTEKMSTLASRTKDDPHLRFVSITVDPENDTPPVLDAFASRYSVDPERWHMLTGDAAYVEKTVLEGFKMALKKENATVVFHSERFVLIDKRGHMRGVFDTEPSDLDALLLKAKALQAE